MREKDSVAAYFVQAMIHGLGDDPQRLAAALEQAGVDPALLEQPSARVPASAFAALWLIQIRELNDEFFRLDSHGMLPGSFALICRALIQEPDLHKAMRQCLSNFSLFLSDYRGTLTVRGKRAVISLDTCAPNADVARFGEETFLVLMISLMCWLAGRRIPIDRADFRHERLSLSDDRLLWGPNLTFGAERLIDGFGIPAVIAVAAGESHMVLTNPSGVQPQIDSGRLRAIAVTGAKRESALPNVPTFKEVGLEPVNRMAYYGIYGPKGLPKEVVDKVSAAVKTTVALPEVKARIEGTGSLVVLAQDGTWTSLVNGTWSDPANWAGNILASGINNTATFNAATGVITLEDPPPDDAVITAGFEFDTPVRFDADRLDMSLVGHGAARVMRVPLVEIAG